MQDSDTRMRGVAHDINGVMARAMLIAEQLQNHGDCRVSARANRIGAAISQVTEICRMELTRVLPAECVDNMTSECIGYLLQHVVNLAGIESMLSDKPIDFYVSVTDDSTLSADAPTVFRIVFNLVLNAANAIARHGGSWIDVSVERAEEWVHISVLDNGPGLPDHVVGFLYPNLVWANEKPVGHIGTGLITVANLAAELDGKFELIETSDAGTHFLVSLPAGDQDAVPLPEDSPTVQASRAIIDAYR